MTQRIEIEGDVVRIVEHSVLQTATLADVLPFIENRPPVLMFHPRSAIFTHWDESNPGRKIVRYLCELAPGIKNIVKSDRRYRLAMPWTYFLFSFESGGDIFHGGSWSMGDHKVFHSNAQVTGPDSRLWTAFLPNVYEEGNICFGSTGVPVNQPLAGRIDQIVNEWYMTQFNGDVIGGRRHPLPFNAAYPTPGFRPWVDATTQDGAAAWLSFPEWQDTTGSTGATSRTVRELLQLSDDRMAPRTVTEAIPAIPTVPTFGAAEEWLNALTPVQRRRLLIGLNNIGADTPDAIAPAEAVLNAPARAGEDGGEPI